jgi:response regulator RpfG family c-di-GMP phosphodiesterase
VDLLFVDDNPTNLKVYTTIAARELETMTRLMRAMEYRDNERAAGTHFDPMVVEAFFCCESEILQIMQRFADAAVAA